MIKTRSKHKLTQTATLLLNADVETKEKITSAVKIGVNFLATSFC